MIDYRECTSTTTCVCCGGYVNDGWVCDACQEKYQKSTLDPVKIEQCVAEMNRFISDIASLKHPPVSDKELLKIVFIVLMVKAIRFRRR